ncbi:twitching motility protein PilT [Campylobacterota bacterium]|nr:twitching motility protein PilT [Campylobacterota bacterium]
MIGYFRGIDKPQYNILDELIVQGIRFGINHHIYMELLQGTKTEREFEQLREYLGSLPFYELKYGEKSYEKAAQLHIKCRQNGVTIRSTIDLIIAQTAIENELYLLHNDADYANMAKVIPQLKIYRIDQPNEEFQ